MTTRIWIVASIVVAGTFFVGYKFGVNGISIRFTSAETPPAAHAENAPAAPAAPAVDPPAASAQPQTAKVADYTIAGPYTHDNLSVYLVHGADRLKGKHYITLQEALDEKKVVVYETGNVNKLEIENLSGDVDVYIQSGDIVKGGRQDRTISMDFIVPPLSGRMEIDAFCVEHGRWTQRGGEVSSNFSSSANAVAGRELKLAVKAHTNQGEVWQKAAENSDRLDFNTGLSVRDPQSASSFELTLENKKLHEQTDAYATSLAGAVANQQDVIGYVTVISGKINSADVYGSHELFLKLWPKLVNTASVEAFADLEKGKTFQPITIDAIKAAMEDAEKGVASSKDVTSRVQVLTHESKNNVVFETRDRFAINAAAANSNNSDRLDFNTGLSPNESRTSTLALDVDADAYVHRSYLSKEPEPAAMVLDVDRQR